MKITTVSYTKTFNLGNYCSERIGAEIEISEGDNVEHGLDEAKKIVEEFHRKNNPISTSKENPIEIVKIDEAVEEQQILGWIEKCTNKERLLTYKYIARKYESTKLAYLTKEKELTDAKR
jgi:hypothetical protein